MEVVANDARRAAAEGATADGERRSARMAGGGGLGMAWKKRRGWVVMDAR